MGVRVCWRSCETGEKRKRRARERVSVRGIEWEWDKETEKAMS